MRVCCHFHLFLFPRWSRSFSYAMDSQPAQHSYGTRIRQNITIKPSARLRQSPDPPVLKINRKLKPSPTSTTTTTSSTQHEPTNSLPFPFPPNVILHPEDALSKTLLAMAKSFWSVVRNAYLQILTFLFIIFFKDNRAMTIKDLSEMVLQFGLACATYVAPHIPQRI